MATEAREKNNASSTAILGNNQRLQFSEVLHVQLLEGLPKDQLCKSLHTALFTPTLQVSSAQGRTVS